VAARHRIAGEPFGISTFQGLDLGFGWSGWATPLSASSKRHATLHGRADRVGIRNAAATCVCPGGRLVEASSLRDRHTVGADPA
jgi:hypothetical protein